MQTVKRGRPLKERENVHEIRRNVRLTEELDAKLLEVARRLDIPPEVLIRSYVVRALRELDRAPGGIDRRKAG